MCASLWGRACSSERLTNIPSNTVFAEAKALIPDRPSPHIVGPACLHSLGAAHPCRLAYSLMLLLTRCLPGLMIHLDPLAKPLVLLIDLVGLESSTDSL